MFSLYDCNSVILCSIVLIKQCPRQYLNEFAKKLVSQGRKPELLDIFVGMTALSEVMGSRVMTVDSEIAGYLTSREWKKHFLLWCTATPGSIEYKERIIAMESVRDVYHDTTITEEHLTPQLLYHINILTLLANCNLGPKLHAIYPVQDILSGIMDPITIFPVKKALGNLLIEVLKSSRDHVEKIDLFWLLLEQFSLELEQLPTEMFNLSRNQILRIQKGEWVKIAVIIIATFFEHFDLLHFIDSQHKQHQPNGGGNGSPISGKFSSSYSFKDHDNDNDGLPQQNVIMTIERLHRALKQLLDRYATKLGGPLSEEVKIAVNELHRHIDIDGGHGQGNGEHVPTALHEHDTKIQTVRMRNQRNSVVYADVQQAYYRTQFKQFLIEIKPISTTTRDEIITIFKKLPSIHDNELPSTRSTTSTSILDSIGDVRLEPLIKKLSNHFRGSIKRNSLNRSIEEEKVETCMWYLKAMRYLFEDALHVTFEDMNNVDVGTFMDTVEADRLRNIYNDQGVTYLCLDLMAIGVEHDLAIEAMKLLVVMLFKCGGCIEIQTTIHNYLIETDSRLLFEFIKDMIESVKSYCNKELEVLTNTTTTTISIHYKHNNIINKQKEIVLPEDILVFTFLQSICEGSFMKNREQIREQIGNSKIINIIEILASLIGIMSRIESYLTHSLTVTVLKTVLRLVQGPCIGNQDQFILHTELLISLNRMIRSARPISGLQVLSTYSTTNTTINNNKQLECFKECIVDLLRGIIEGQSKSSLSFDRVNTTIDFSVLQLLMIPIEKEILDSLLGSNSLTNLQAKYLALSESMKKSFIGDHTTSTQKVTSSNNTEETLKEDIASVEIQWNSQVHVVYFPIPQIVKDLSNESKERIINKDEDFPSKELKLIDFINNIKILYRESLHQQYLKTNYKLSNLWTFKYYLIRLMFANAIVMNVLIVAYYGTSYHADHYYGGSNHHSHTVETDDHAAVATDDHHRILAGTSTSSATYGLHDHLYVPHKIETVLTWLNIVHLGFAIITFAIFCLVRIPVTFATEYEKHKTYISAIVNTVLDPLPVWYFVYCVFTFLGLEVHHFFVSALLLDWIAIDSTSQDLLKAIKHPAKQLIATLVIILITQNIFAGIMFIYFRHEVKTVQIRDMWDALKLCISYGFRGEYGIDYEMSPTLGIRMVYDVIFFIVVSM